MSGAKFTDEFKRDAVAQVGDRYYPVREVAERLGVSTKSVYKSPIRNYVRDVMSLRACG